MNIPNSVFVYIDSLIFLNTFWYVELRPIISQEHE